MKQLVVDSGLVACDQGINFIDGVLDFHKDFNLLSFNFAKVFVILLATST